MLLEPRDAFFVTEEWFEKVGKLIRIPPQKNVQLKVVKAWAKKRHEQQSEARRILRVYKKMGKVNGTPPLIDRPLKQIKRILK